MSQGSHSAQPYCLCFTRLGTPQSDRLSNPSDRLQGEAPDAVKLLDSATQMSICSNGACVSPGQYSGAKYLAVCGVCAASASSDAIG